MLKISFCILNYYEDWLVMRAIAQVYNYVDEILIGDGSRGKDFTERMVKGLPKCKVIQPPEDFDEGEGFNWAEWRNYVQSFAKGDYIMWQDPDELYPLRFMKDLKMLLSGEEAEAIGLIRIAYEDHKRILERNKEVKVRIWKRKSNVKWVGKIHENPQGFSTYIVWKIPYSHDILWLPSFPQRIYKLKKRAKRGNILERIKKEDLDPYNKYFKDELEDEAFESRE